MDIVEGMRSDVATELIKGVSEKPIFEKIKRFDVTVDDSLSARLNKPKGRYTTVESDVVYGGERENYDRLIAALSDTITEYVGKVESCLVACLGNPKMTADALGALVADRLIVTRHLVAGKGVSVCCVTPNVFGATGIESFDIVKGVSDKVKPDVVIAVDSLASASVKRIGSAFQLSDTGITPGSGVFNHRQRLDKKSLGVKVVSFGVPLVVYASTIVNDALGEGAKIDKKICDEIRELVVTPKDIDVLASDCAFVMAEAINRAMGFSDASSAPL